MWRQRRSRCGELVQWDTSDHDWLEGRGSESLYLISMIDDATSRLYARFVSSDSTEENMRTLRQYLELYGRPVAFYTDRASLFHTTEKRRRDAPGVDQDPKLMPPTQIGRALRDISFGLMRLLSHTIVNSAFQPGAAATRYRTLRHLVPGFVTLRTSR